MSNNLFEILTSCKRFRLNDTQRVTGWNNDTRRFGELRLPYERVWIEWNNQRNTEYGYGDIWQAALCVPFKDYLAVVNALSGEEKLSQHLSKRAEHVIQNIHHDKDINISWVIFGFAIINGGLRTNLNVLKIGYDKNQKYIGMDGYVEEVFPQKEGTDSTSNLIDLYWDALVAIGWINCKNVTTQEHERRVNPKKQRRKPNATKAQGLKYSTIHLPNEPHSNGTTKGSSGTNCEKSLHTVRGHFKTFTEDKPLLGKHVGTYWWGWQVRGSKEVGEVVSDYKVSAPSAI